MKSYPYRISIKMNEVEKDWERPVEVAYESQGKVHVLTVKWAQAKAGCYKPVSK
jgi:hypothetical protein